MEFVSYMLSKCQRKPPKYRERGSGVRRERMRMVKTCVLKCDEAVEIEPLPGFDFDRLVVSGL